MRFLSAARSLFGPRAATDPTETTILGGANGAPEAIASAAPPQRHSVASSFGAVFGGGIEAGLSQRRLRKIPTTQAHINALLSQMGRTVQARARYLVVNNGYAANAVEGWTSNVVASGIVPAFESIRGKSAKTQLSDLFGRFVDEADADGITNLYGLQDRAVREIFIAGEVFIRKISRRREAGLAVPLQLQIIPSEMLPLHNNVPAAGGNYIRQGIEFDTSGRRVAYHFLTGNPTDPTERVSSSVTVRVPADEVLHLIDPAQAGQLRGLSRFTPSTVKALLLDIYDDAELDRKKVAAMYAVFIETEDKGGWSGDQDDGLEDRTIDLQPGATVFLEPGEKAHPSMPADSGSSYEPFQYRTLLQVCAGWGVPYSIVTGDMLKANYSNTRAQMVEFRRRVEAFQFRVMVFQMCRPVLGWFLDAAHMSGALSLSRYEGQRSKYLSQIEWLPPKFEWVDPWKDAQAEIVQIDRGLKSRSMAIRERGYDPEKVDDEIAAEQEREKRLNLRLGSPERFAQIEANRQQPA